MKRVLVISNNCFSKTNSNGRTLGNLFVEYEKEKISQFFISGVPDYDYCQNYYQVSDEDVLRATIPFYRDRTKQSNAKTSDSVKRSSKNMLLRNFIWNLGLWKNNKFKNWLKEVNPEVIVLQVGDCAFFIKLALKIARTFKANIVIYNTEAYYFKNYNYFNDGHNFIFKMFISSYRKTFNKLMKKASISIYLNDALKELYSTAFSSPSSVIYNSSLLSFESFNNSFPSHGLSFCYIGNLGLGRDDSLIKMGNLLHSLNPLCCIDVYGKCNDTTKMKFEKCAGINYKGFADYDSVEGIIKRTDVLIHVESFEDFYVEGAKYGFSGKIADSLKSNCAFVIFAPKDIYCVRYFKENELKLIATNLKELEDVLFMLLNDKDSVNNEILKQHHVYEKRHDLISNAVLFEKIINGEA